MPRVESVTIHRRTIALRRPFVTALRTAHAVEALLVEVRDSDGRSGWGEAPTNWAILGESAQSVTAAIEGPIRDAVLGRSTSDPQAASLALERAVARNPSARAAVDCAIHDLAAAAAGVPLFRYLGGKRATVRTDMTLSAAASAEDADELVRTAAEHASGGFTTLKIKTGAGADDVAAVAAARAAVGSGVRLRVDANQAWTPARAVEIISAWEDAGLDIELVEQPVHRDDLDGLARVRAEVSTPILADESVWSVRDLREIIERRAADLINVKLAKTGGLRHALALAELASEHGVDVVVGCMVESHVGVAAAAAFASALTSRAPARPAVDDLDMGLWLTRSPVVGGVAYDAETIQLADAPGTGISGLAPDGGRDED